MFILGNLNSAGAEKVHSEFWELPKMVMVVVDAGEQRILKIDVIYSQETVPQTPNLPLGSVYGEIK